uniref:RNA-directed DNA polymerase, eukaryota n=1 Tax=Tanacetum cinerariifolium TaxID=118510 RepID=A0A699QFB5_TANCI|nr:RNA-directed DNA polymerase, eukaryota [Tanacetum cinerariifolium]
MLINLKTISKAWSKDAKYKTYVDKSEINNKLLDFNKNLDHGGYNDETINERSTLIKDIHDLESLEALEIAQKAKVHWSIEGDENTKHFHDILNNKISQLAIRGIFVDREWITDPYKVKSNFLVHFLNRFAKPNPSRIKIDFCFPNCLSSAQAGEMKHIVSYNETKHVV